MIISTQRETLFDFAPMNTPQRCAFVGIVFALVTQGVAVIEVDGRPQTMSQSGLLTILPSHLLWTRECSNDFQCLTLAFTFESMVDFPYMVQTMITEKIEQTPTIRLEEKEFQQLENLHRIIAAHHQAENNPSYREILRSLIFVFTAQVSAIYSNIPMKTSANHREKLTDGFFRLLHSNFRTDRQAAFYANKLCVSPKHLAKVISGITGHSPSYWIADFTVREAKTLIKSTTLNITQISEELNFANSSFFARYFKRHTGTAPQEYKRANSYTF